MSEMQQVEWQWPGGKPLAVIFNVCLEAWSDGKAPGISPMGNPLPAGALDTMAISWASYGVKRGIYRLLDVLAAHGAKASVMTSAIISERSPEAVRAVADAGHEVLSHSYTMDVIPALLSVEENLPIARHGNGPAIIDVTVHAHIFGRPRGAHYFGEIVARAAAASDIWIATRQQIADLLLKQ